MSAQPTVTIPRVEAWLKSQGLDYEVVPDGSIITGFERCRISISDCDSDFLIVASSWRGEFSAADLAPLAAHVEEHNSTMYAPRATMSPPDEDGAVHLQADMTAFTTEGMSDAQLHDFMDVALSTLLSFYETAGEAFPDLVTWTEED